MRRKILFTGACLCAYLIHPSLAAASAVDVPPEARGVAAGVWESAKAVLYAEQAEMEKVRAEAYVQKTETYVADLQKQIDDLQQALVKQQKEADALEVEAEHSADVLEKAKQAAADLHAQAKVAWERAASAAESAGQQEKLLSARIVALQERNKAAARQRYKELQNQAEDEPYVPEETDELLVQEAQIRRMEAEMHRGDVRDISSEILPPVQPTEDLQAEINAAHARAAALQSEAESMNRASEAAFAQVEIASAAREELFARAAKARQAFLDTQYILRDTKTTAQGAEEEAAGAKAYLEQFLFEQQNPPPYRYMSVSSDFYSWHDGAMKGQQWVIPYYFGYSEKKLNFGFAVSSIWARNRTEGQKGSIRTFSDTSLYLNQRNEKKKFLVDYNFTVNVPTGKASLSASQRNARMNEDLVRYSQFGEGWNFTPGIAVTRKIGKEDSWTFGTGYSFRGAYDPTSDVALDQLHPGDEWQKFIRWQHAGQDWQFVGEVIHTAVGTSRVENGSRYDTGDQWKTRLTYNRVLSPSRSFMLYYWYDKEESEIDLGREVEVSPVHYFGGMWRKTLPQNRTLRFTFDVMKVNGHRYDSLRNTYVDGRDKYTAGIGYDVQLKGERILSLDLQRFVLADGTTSNNDASRKYKGFNMFLKFSGAF